MSSTMQPHRHDSDVQVATGSNGSGVRAWISVVLIPVLLLVSVFATTLAYQVLGYKPEDSNIPLWADTVAALVAAVFFLPPCVAAVVYGARSGRAGDWKGWVALTLGALAGVGLVTLTFFGTFGPF